MTGPVVYIDSSDVRPGRLTDLKAAIADLVDFLEPMTPRDMGYGVYFDPSGQHMTVVHMHPDAASLEHHLAVGAPRFQAFRDLVQLRRITILGEVPSATLDRVREKARLLGAAAVETHAVHAGFTRSAAVAPTALDG